jgi:hypothetical protein
MNRLIIRNVNTRPGKPGPVWVSNLMKMLIAEIQTP